jgi:molybdopterin-guanine dinucleotide biosynthesis protein MobB
MSSIDQSTALGQIKKNYYAPILAHLPILGICGQSGAGKTTLIEAILPGLVRQGLRVAVVKHDCRNLVVDVPGKDSDRFYQAGADVFLLGGEEFMRLRGEGGADLKLQLISLARRYDLVLVEGHARSPVPKIWLLSENELAAPGEIEAVLGVFAREENRNEQVMSFLLQWLEDTWLRTPVWACVLIGGRSSRMGCPKHLIAKEEAKSSITWLEHTVGLLQPLIGGHIALSGAGRVPESLAHLPRLPDVPGVYGPLTGIIAATRWQPLVSWLLLACDMPDISAKAVNWLLSRRHPGLWGTVPCLDEDGYVEPLLAHYDFRCGPLFESLLASGSLRIGQIARQNKVETPLIPLNLTTSWHNINTPEELAVSRQVKVK